MISAEFAPNEQVDDAILSLSLIFQPWRWESGIENQRVRRKLGNFFNTNQSNVFMFLSGRAALFQLLLSLDIQKDSEVLVTGFTCEAVAVPIMHAGLKPVYVDIEEKTYGMNITHAKQQINTNTKVMIIQHSFGIVPQYRKDLIHLARQHKLIVIEDVAHGIDEDYFEKDRFKTIKLLSGGRSKSFSSVFAGAVICEDEDINSRLHEQQNKLIMPAGEMIIRLLLYKPYTVFIKKLYDVVGIGKMLHRISNGWNLILPEITQKEKHGEFDDMFNKAYPNVLAILLYSQLKKRNRVQKTRAGITEKYAKQFHLPYLENLALSRFPILVENKEVTIRYTRKQHIFLGKWYTQPIDPAQVNLVKMMYERGTCPVAESICEKVVNLPTCISTREAEKVIECIDNASNNTKSK